MSDHVTSIVVEHYPLGGWLVVQQWSGGCRVLTHFDDEAEAEAHAAHLARRRPECV